MIGLSVTAIALFFVQPTDVHAQAHELVGEWQQLTSNSGPCPLCRITFSGDGIRLSVTANNGWSADVEVRESDSGTSAAGQGNWRIGVASSTVSKPLKVDFALRDQRLYMTLVGEFANGRRQTVKAVFGRPWFGA